MATYLLRRLLLFFPTLIGATLLVFLVLAAAPGDFADTLMASDAEQKPEVREARREALNEQFGLNKPILVQYFRWLNGVSPIGFSTWTNDDARVVESRIERQKQREPIRAQIAAERAAIGKLNLLTQESEIREITRRVKELQAKLDDIEVSPAPGEIRFNRPALKVPNFGRSITRKRPVWELIKEAVPITLLLQAISLPITYFLAVVTGVWAAKHRGKAADVVSGTSSIALYSIPSIWICVLAIGFLANSKYAYWFPPGGLNTLGSADWSFFPGTSVAGRHSGWFLDYLWHLILPVICLSYGNIAFLHKLTRGALLETIQLDFVRTARAKGVDERRVLWAHAFRNSLLPLVTVGASLLPALVSGSIIVESVFGVSGMGRLSVEAVDQKDVQLLLSTTLVTMVLTLLGYLVADLLYVVVDPRVSYDA